LIALNSGLPGMCTIHANNAREAIAKLCTLPLLAGENVSYQFVVPTVASCIDLVVHAETDAEGRRRVREIVAVPGRVEGDVVATAFGLIAAYAPFALVRYRQHKRRSDLRALWPEVVDNLASGVRAGLSLPESLTQVGVRGPEQLRGPFAAFGEDYRATGRFDT